jgi:biotin carboxyl carrier protein
MKRYRITVDGVEYRIEVEEYAAGVYKVKIGDKQVTVTAQEITGSEIVAARKNRGREPAGSRRNETVSNSTSIVQMTSPMPGNVVSVVASKGTKVELGDPVIILEAMKMKNEIPAPVNGIVREIHVKEGDTVDSEEIIASIEEVNDVP